MKDLKETLDNVKDQAKDIGDNVGDKAGQVVKDGVDKLKDVFHK